MSIEVLNESGHAVAEHEVLGVARHVMSSLHVHPRTDLCVRFVDEASMSRLHEQWMDLPGPTDVMSFPMDELRPGRGDRDLALGTLGDVVVCPSVAEAQAAAAGHAADDEMLLLVVHGMLHLLGFDHGDPAEEREMFDLQRSLLLTFLAERGRASSTAPDSAASRAAAARAIQQEPQGQSGPGQHIEGER